MNRPCFPSRLPEVFPFSRILSPLHSSLAANLKLADEHVNASDLPSTSATAHATQLAPTSTTAPAARPLAPTPEQRAERVGAVLRELHTANLHLDSIRHVIWRALGDALPGSPTGDLHDLQLRPVAHPPCDPFWKRVQNVAASIARHRGALQKSGETLRCVSGGSRAHGVRRR